MADNDYIPPVAHSRLSRTGHALGGAAEKGFEAGFWGGVIGYFTFPLIIAASILFGVPESVMSTGQLVLASVGSLIATSLPIPFSPFTWLNMGMAAIGAGSSAPFGMYFGAKKANEITGQERAAYEFDAAYMARKAQLQGAFMAQMQQAEMLRMGAAMPQPEPQAQPAPLPEVKSDIRVPESVTAKCEPKKDEPKKPELTLAANNAELPLTKIAAESVQHQARLTPELRAAEV